MSANDLKLPSVLMSCALVLVLLISFSGCTDDKEEGDENEMEDVTDDDDVGDDDDVPVDDDIGDDDIVIGTPYNYTVTGMVRDAATGLVIQGANVTVKSEHVMDMGYECSAITLANGSYLMDHVPGQYVTGESDGEPYYNYYDLYMTVIHPDYFMTSQKIKSAGTTVDISLIPGGRISGNVAVPANTTEGDYHVCLKMANGSAFRAGTGSEITILAFPVDANGTFQSPLLEPGKYTLNVNSRYYAPSNWTEIGVTALKNTKTTLASPTAIPTANLYMSTGYFDDFPVLIFNGTTLIGGGFVSEHMLNISLPKLGNYSIHVNYYRFFFSSFTGEEHCSLWNPIDVVVEERFKSTSFGINIDDNHPDNSG